MEIIGQLNAGVGTIYQWTFTLPLGLKFSFKEVVTEWLEPERFAYRAISNWEMEAINALIPKNGGTTISFTLRYQFPPGWNWLIPRWVVKLGCWYALGNINHGEN